ncbi:MAG: amidohydrolase family protein [Planctomycetaceae bacterium]|jgi:dihydroorotase|nr:amidohydrolase family protein [Planctomycetaceae bacterium]MBT6153216.1 amidohydrolase family protein [Planctomycetaceae bacterium]MBT6484590.1 amidohydrolase family protein [Planctomycetaceae bacterium]MBT6495642.1 amidohydrolase family protein [Planctomycetaceae bacterium]
MTDDVFDLLIRAGRLFCADSNLDEPGAVAIRDGRIVVVGADVSGSAKRTLEFPAGVLLPGLIDLHAHPATAESVFGVEPDEFVLRRGTTTVGSQGDAGADNWPTYRDETIAKSQARVLLAMNLSRVGESTEAGCLERLDDADVDACVSAIESAGDSVWAIAVNVSHNACGESDPREVLQRGLTVAAATDLPLLFGMRRPEDWSLAEQLEQLRPGDVVTYCFRREPHCIVSGGRVLPEIHEARKRGILFDVGHGCGSFDFDVAATAIADGFPPDTISTDLQRRHVEMLPQHDLPLMMSKLHAAGMPIDDVFTAVTHAPAMAMGRPHLGTLATDTAADLTVLAWDETIGPLADTSGKSRNGGQWNVLLTVRGGTIAEAAD